MNANFDGTVPSSTPPSQPIPRPIAKIAEALAKAQGEIVQPEKNKVVEVKDRDGKKLYDFEYADYNAIVESVRIPLSKHAICFTHLIEEDRNGLVLVTRLIHSSGEYLESIYPLPRTQNPKDLGGAITYGKRYVLSAITGCVADDDDDGSATNKPGQETTAFKDKKPVPTQKGPVVQPKDQAPPKPAPVTASEIAQLFGIAGDHKWSQDQVKLYMESRWKISTTRELTRERYDNLVEVIKTRTFPLACQDIVSRGQS